MKTALLKKTNFQTKLSAVLITSCGIALVATLLTVLWRDYIEQREHIRQGQLVETTLLRESLTRNNEIINGPEILEVISRSSYPCIVQTGETNFANNRPLKGFPVEMPLFSQTSGKITTFAPEPTFSDFVLSQFFSYLTLLAFGLLTAYLLHRRFRRLVVTPLSDLASTAASITKDRDMSRRAPKHNEDEVGQLADVFNAMLDCVQQREDELQRTRKEIEEQVHLRTQELTIANAQLLKENQERAALEAQLQQTVKMEAIGKLAGGVAHDFNNILTVILGHTTLLKSPVPDSLREKSVNEIEKAAQRASQLTQQLLAFSRRQHFQKRPIDINAQLQDTSKMLQRLVGDTITMAMHLDPALPFAQADPNAVGQIIMNLIINARDAMNGKGALMLSTSVQRLQRNEIPHGYYACLEVKDTGCGMSPETLQHVFEPFFTTKPVGKGTGLGLATTYGIVRQHDGWIDVESVEGKGTTFRVYLPLCEEQNLPKEQTKEVEVVRGGTETILVVEDEEPVRCLVAYVLRRYGYKVIEAQHAKQALSLWEKHHKEIDLLFTDMIMPEGISGKELAKRLIHSKPTLPVIIASGYSEELIASKKGGINYQYVAKPFDTTSIAALIRNTLDAQKEAQKPTEELVAA